MKLRARETGHHTGAGDGGGSTVQFRGQSPALHTVAADVPAMVPRHHHEVSAIEAWALCPGGALLDFRADKEEDSLSLMAAAAAAVLSERAGCTLQCAVAISRAGQTPLTAGTSDAAVDLARWDRSSANGPVSQALGGKLAVIVNDFSWDSRWPGFRAPLRDAGYRSLVSVPLDLEPECPAALTLMAEEPDAFAPAVLADVVLFCKVAASSFVLASDVRVALAAAGHLRTAMEGRTSIDVACGVIMGQNRCSYQEAFNIIAKAASNRNVKVRVVAESLLEDLPGGAPATHFAT